MSRSGHTMSVKRLTKLTTLPVVIAPASTRHAPTASRTTIATPGSASSTASKLARMVATRTLASRSRSDTTRKRSLSTASAPSALTVRTPSKLSWATAETRPICSCRVLRRPVHAALVDDVQDEEAREQRVADDRQPRVGEDQPHRGHDDDHDYAGGERQRVEDLGGRVHVVAGVGQQLAGGLALVVLEGHLLVALDHAAAQRRPHPSAGDRGRDAARDDARALDETDAHDGEDRADHRPGGDLALLEARDDHRVGDPAQHVRRADRGHGVDGRAEDGRARTPGAGARACGPTR